MYILEHYQLKCYGYFYILAFMMLIYLIYLDKDIQSKFILGLIYDKEITKVRIIRKFFTFNFLN